MTLRSLAGALATGLVLALASPALGASGITPLSPKSGATVPTGTSPTFKMRVKGAGQVLKRGTVIKSIRLTGDAQEIDCRYEAIKGLVLRAEFVRKL